LSVVVVLLIVVFRLPQAELNPWHFVGTSLHPAMIAANLLLVQSPSQSILGPLWSLPYEMAMYLFLPWLFLFLYPYKSLWRVVGIWAISLLACAALIPYLGPASRNFLLYVPCFLPGVIAYQLQRTTRPQFPAILWPGVIIATLLLFLYKQHLVSNPWLKSWFACLAFGLPVVFFAQVSSSWLTVPSRLIAKYSYGIYLTHFFCIWLAFNRLEDAVPRIARLALFAALVTGLPVFFYHWLEEPMVLLGKRVAKRFERITVRWPISSVRIPS
jgi:peptidoglycan/LPS O-acetylase OafA/YrhL